MKARARTPELSKAPPVALREAGHVLLLALVTLLLTAAALALVAGSLTVRLESLKRQVVETHLVALGDAALAETLARLAQVPSFAGVAERPFGGGRIASRVEPVTAQVLRVRATAVFGGKRRALEVIVERTASGPVVVAWRRLPGAG